MSTAPIYTAEAVMDDDVLSDIRIHIDGKVWHLWGRNGAQRETDLADSVPEGVLPVLIGAGLGRCIDILLDRGLPVAVVDKEESIDEVTSVKSRFTNTSDLLWVDADAPEPAFEQLARWQSDNGNMPLFPVIAPLYLRLNRAYYGALAETVKANAQTDFWSQARYPKFSSANPKVLFFDSSYFLCGEIIASLDRLGISHRTMKLDQSGIGNADFIETLLKTAIDFKPDFVLTVNHFGLDREGKLAGLLDDLQLPLASWFVDNPHLILHRYAHPGTENTVIFTYDAGNLDQLRAKGFPNVHYLPLATDPARFKPGLGADAPPEWTSDVSFVGNSMTEPVAKCLAESALPEPWHEGVQDLAAAYGESGNISVTDYLRENQPEWLAILEGLPTRENQLAMESLITWEATRQYRLKCVKETLKFTPLIVGDKGWKDLLGIGNRWRHLPGLSYYDDLPRFYPLSKVNFNCTSRQMVGAVNQRVFDVPACGGFVLTDSRQQMDNLFDLDSEVAVYRTPEEIPGLIRRYLKDGEQRRKVSEAARKRILAEHTYEIRLGRLLDIMRNTFA